MDRLRSRREFLEASALGAVASTIGLGAVSRGFGSAAAATKRDFKISLAGWSLHRAVSSKTITQLDMPKICRQEFDIGAVEFVSGMFASTEPAHLDKLVKNAQDNNVDISLVMVDGQGSLGHRAERARDKAVEGHSKWVDITKHLGARTMRVNWSGAKRGGEKDPAEVADCIKRSRESFLRLLEYAGKKDVDVVIENHGGMSSYPEILVRLMKAVDSPRFGTLPDFGNFPNDVDRYEAVRMMMPYAKAVSAKCYDFDEEGNETKLDYPRLIKIVVDDAGYHGNIGIEYEGGRLGEMEGIAACNKLLDRLRG